MNSNKCKYEWKLKKEKYFINNQLDKTDKHFLLISITSASISGTNHK